MKKRTILPVYRHGLLILIVLLFSITSALCCAEELEITFQNTYDKTQQQAVAYIPEMCKTRDNNPLLVVAHYMGGDRYTARKSGYYPECDKRGYLLVCPELHGHRADGRNSLASLEAQHDIVDAVNFMKQNYSVDTSRIYIVGRSMGGMLSQMMAAKYPDLFAAAVSGQGISDLSLWYRTSIPSLIQNVEKECGPFSEETRFDYERRSSINYAPNIKYVPLILWHGTNDTWVPPEQSENLVATVRKYNRFQPEVNWLHCAAHCPTNFTAEWVCNQLTYYQNICEAGFNTPTRFFPELTIVTDEAKNFYWLGITPVKTDSFARVNASLMNDILFVRGENVREVTIDLNKVSRQLTFAKFDIQSDSQLHFSIIRDGKTLLEIATAANTMKTGELPDKMFVK